MAAMTIRKTVLITGGSRGIGAATVRLFAARGWQVAFTWASQAVPAAEGVSAYRCDVRNEAEVTGLFRQVAADFGRIDALVNNAGITGPRCRIGDVTADLLRDMTATNLIGPVLCAREAIRHMAHLGGGSIVSDRKFSMLEGGLSLPFLYCGTGETVRLSPYSAASA
jgi:NAD(P)-dependent dehydrogenase (short-subunit alcohol dehydrogenase family)